MSISFKQIKIRPIWMSRTKFQHPNELNQLNPSSN